MATTLRAVRETRVPAPTPSFWVLKVLTTGTGEALSDFLVTRFDPAPTVVVSVLLFAVVLGVQLRARRHVPWLYWTTVAMVGVVGTLVADVAHVALGVPYGVSTSVFLVVLVVVFVTWRRSTGTLDVHAVTSTRRQSFSWAAVIATFALGTAAGDLVASAAHLGYLGAAVLFVVAVVVVVVLRIARITGPVVTFWTAYVLTRPVGASFADWFAVTPRHGGLGFGTGLVSAVGIIAIVVGVVATAQARRRSGRPGERFLGTDARP